MLSKLMYSMVTWSPAMPLTSSPMWYVETMTVPKEPPDTDVSSDVSVSFPRHPARLEKIKIRAVSMARFQ